MADAAPWSRLKSELYSLVGRNPRSNRLMPSIADLAESHSVLDVGCGPGAAVRAAAPMVERAVGIDRSEAMVEIARRRSRRFDNVEFEAGGAEQLPFPDSSFDRVWTIHAFHHWEDRVRGVTEALRVLRPGGLLLIVESDTKGAHGLNRERAMELSERLRSLGFAEASATKPRKEWVVAGVLPPDAG
jgi:ubiquinone/menaquinone biosynthesis C-methylase UbiE